MAELSLILRVYLGTVWLLAGIGKMVDPAGQLPLPRRPALDRVAPAATRLLAICEVALGLLLIAGAAYRAAPLASALLFAAFAAAHLTGKIRGKCNCFGVLQRRAAIRPQQLLLWSGFSLWLAWAGAGSLFLVAPRILLFTFGMVILGIAGGATILRWRSRVRAKRCPVCAAAARAG